MRRQTIKMLSMMFVLLFALTSIELVPALAAEGRTAKIYDYSNTVTVIRGKSSLKVYKSMRLKEGDTIKTGENSIAYIEIDSDKVVKMDSSTIITLSNFDGTDKNGSINISLTSGKIFNDIKKKLTKNSTYKVRTPNAVMGVRGTTFVVGIKPLSGDNHQTELSVLDGTVAFAASQQEHSNVFVEMNQKANTTQLTEDKLPKVTELNTTDLGTFELEEIVNNSELKNNISEVLKQERTTLDEVLEQAKKKENGFEKRKNQDGFIESDPDGKGNIGNGNLTQDNNGNGNLNTDPNNNGNGSTTPSSGGNGNPNANPNNNGNGSTTPSSGGNGNPNANPNNNGNGSTTPSSGGNGNPNVNPNNNGNGSTTPSSGGNGNPNANPNNNGNGSTKPNSGGNGNPNANPNNNGNGSTKPNSGGNGNPNANPNNNGNGKDK